MIAKKNKKIIYYLVFLIGILITLYSCFDYIRLKKVCTQELNVECVDVYTLLKEN